jgi:hypothetical protein
MGSSKAELFKIALLGPLNTFTYVIVPKKKSSSLNLILKRLLTRLSMLPSLIF